MLASGLGYFILRSSDVTPANADATARHNEILGYITTGFGNSFIRNGPSVNRADVPKHVQTNMDAAIVDEKGCVHTDSEWDEAWSRRGIYCNGQPEVHDQNDAPAVNSKELDLSGGHWSINGTAVDGPGGKQITGLVKPTSLGTDRPHNYLMVADSGNGQYVINFYDVSGAPKLVRTFGERGGIEAGTPGQITPFKFFGTITGTGTDSDGNIYVIFEEHGSVIRSFTPDGKTMRWHLESIIWTDTSDFDPTSDGTIFYTPYDVIKMDYSKPIDEQWTWLYHTVNLNKYPDDYRKGKENSTFYRVIKGHKYLFTTSMSQTSGFNVSLFKNADGGYIASPVVRFSSDDMGGYEGDYNVGLDGTLYFANCNKLRTRHVQSIAADGTLSYGPLEDTTFPAPFNCVEKMTYNEATDTMYLGGGTDQEKTNGWGNGGPLLAKYSNWSKSPHQDWIVKIPFHHNDEADVDKRYVQISYSAVGDYIFITYADKDGSEMANADPGESGVMAVYKISDGSFVGRMLPDGPNHGNKVEGSWVDMAAGGTKCMQRSDGTYVCVREEDWTSKQIVYLWKPNGALPSTPVATTPTTQPTVQPTVTATSTRTPTSTPTPAPTPTGTPVTGHTSARNNIGVSSDDRTSQADYDGGGNSNSLQALQQPT